MSALWAALDAARIGEMVRALPDGLDTWVGEGGARFSGGQGRRLALARALLSPAPILILDEPCAGLDAETERAFLATLNDVAEGRSVILITHRLTGVERLDRIWRLSAGKAIGGGRMRSWSAIRRRAFAEVRSIAVDGGLTDRQENAALAREGNRPCAASACCSCFCVRPDAARGRSAGAEIRRVLPGVVGRARRTRRRAVISQAADWVKSHPGNVAHVNGFAEHRQQAGEQVAV